MSIEERMDDIQKQQSIILEVAAELLDGLRNMTSAMEKALEGGDAE
jgi:hypothetical protein